MGTIMFVLFAYTSNLLQLGRLSKDGRYPIILIKFIIAKVYQLSTSLFYRLFSVIIRDTNI
jgi:hypothetical protein